MWLFIYEFAVLLQRGVMTYRRVLCDKLYARFAHVGAIQSLGNRLRTVFGPIL